MAKTLDDLDRLSPVDPDKLASATADLLRRERAWQLRDLRRQAHLTQAQLATAMGVGQNRVSQIESGGAEHVRLGTLQQYADALGGTLRVEIDTGDQRYALLGA
jgi:predicted XRE-type DNA-binding protein